MAFKESASEIVCPRCGSCHKVTWHLIPWRERYRLICKACGGVLDEGRSTCSYDEPRLIDRQE